MIIEHDLVDHVVDLVVRAYNDSSDVRDFLVVLNYDSQAELIYERNETKYWLVLFDSVGLFSRKPYKPREKVYLTEQGRQYVRGYVSSRVKSIGLFKRGDGKMERNHVELFNDGLINKAGETVLNAYNNNFNECKFLVVLTYYNNVALVPHDEGGTYWLVLFDSVAEFPNSDEKNNILANGVEYAEAIVRTRLQILGLIVDDYENPEGPKVDEVEVVVNAEKDSHGVPSETEEIQAANKRSKKLADEHWDDYVSKILEAHGIEAEAIKICGFHYKSAFVHAYKHAVLDQHNSLS